MVSRKRIASLFGAGGESLELKVAHMPLSSHQQALEPEFVTQEHLPSGVFRCANNRPDAAKISLLTGCQDRPYAFGLAMALVKIGVDVDFVGSDDEDCPELHHTPRLKFVNLKRSSRANGSRVIRAMRFLNYYLRLMRYVRMTDTQILHILWNNRFEYFDRTLLLLYFKACRKRILMTAHNINSSRRDGSDSLLNRLTLRAQYRIVDHIFVHTPKMKQELCGDFGVPDHSVTVIRHPVNNAFPNTDLSPREARRRLGIDLGEKVMLFFGRIRPYKGLEYLLSAFEQVADYDSSYRLIIAGECQKGYESYSSIIQRAIDTHRNRHCILPAIGFVPDQDAEIYLKAADVLVLPYKDIFQSGVLFLAYSFGLPVIASDVGSFRDEIIEGQTGFLCKPCDANDLARAIDTYFASNLFGQLSERRSQLQHYAFAQHSWSTVAELTEKSYMELLGRQDS